MALGVIAAGNPRELVRIADLVIPAIGTECDDEAARRRALVDTMAAEALGFRGDVRKALTDGELPAITPEEREGVYGALNQRNFSIEGFESFTAALLAESWVPPWASDGFAWRFLEAWQRLLVRMRIVGKIIGEWPIHMEGMVRLQEVAVVATDSAAEARSMLEDESPPRGRPGLDSEPVRPLGG
jgi:hypothetical protein